MNSFTRKNSGVHQHNSDNNKVIFYAHPKTCFNCEKVMIGESERHNGWKRVKTTNKKLPEYDACLAATTERIKCNRSTSRLMIDHKARHAKRKVILMLS